MRNIGSFEEWINHISYNVAKNIAVIPQVINHKRDENGFIRYKRNIIKLYEYMITGVKSLTHVVQGDMALGNDLYASTRIGKRENQQDAVLLIEDEDISGFKMMVVADGMGGHKHGEKASAIIVDSLKDWFRAMPYEKKKAYFQDISKIQDELTEKINEISQMIIEETNGEGKSTLSCALIGKKQSLIANIGDSRGYIILKGLLKQITHDDSFVQELFDMGIIPIKDLMRFHKKSNIVTKYVGNKESEEVEPHFYTLNNNEYSMILLFSDGVTDCLSEKEIAVICQNSDREEVARRIVENSQRQTSKCPYNLGQQYYDEIKGGKDNSTAAAYIPHSGQEAKAFVERISGIWKLWNQYIKKEER